MCDLSVLIPTRGRPERLSSCLRALARQTLAGDRYEVIVGFDGADADAERSARAAWHDAGGPIDRLRLVTCPGRGYIDVRHRLLPLAEGRILVSLNDDVEPVREFLEVHRREQWRPAVIVGHSPFAGHDRPTLLDRMVAETSMIFFYDAMDEREPDRDWGFRHCFGLNFSAPLDLVRRAGGIPSVPDTYGYDDIELGYRLATRAGLPVLYRPAARAVHHHRYRPLDVLRREVALGIAAARYARIAPDFALAVFRRDVTNEAELDSARLLVERFRPTVAERVREFHRAAAQPAPRAADAAERFYREHIPLKRHLWRCGLLHEMDRQAGIAADLESLIGTPARTIRYSGVSAASSIG